MVKNWPMEKHQSQTYLHVWSTKYQEMENPDLIKIIWREEEKQDCSPILF